MDKVDARDRSVSDLFGKSPYRIDYYQREYRWGEKQAKDLVTDLISAFREFHVEGNALSAVKSYGHYFLGSIILTTRESTTYLVDGQQRLTTLTLLLISIRHLLPPGKQQDRISNMVVTDDYGENVFAIDVQDRWACMDALYDSGSYEPDDANESVLNIVARYQDVTEALQDLHESELPHFAYWLLDKVVMVAITAAAESDAYTIFETMNDRGLSLTPTEMLRGYLLSAIDSEKVRTNASESWRESIASLTAFGKDEDVNAIQAWLRARYAETASQYRLGVAPGHYERIGNEYHRWVRDVESDILGLQDSRDYAKFITRDFAFYARWYSKIRAAADFEVAGFEAVRYIASQGFTLQYALLLAPLRTSDNDETAAAKVRATAAYLDILIHRRLWSSRRIAQTQLRYPLFELAKQIHKATLPQLIDILSSNLSEDEFSFTGSQPLAMNQRNNVIIRRMLARITHFIDRESSRKTRYDDLLLTGKGGYDIEHVLSADPQRLTKDYPEEQDFWWERDFIGGLLLIPSSVNRSYGDLPYGRKRRHYVKENLLAASLHEDAYEKNPNFKRFLKQTGLSFEPYKKFGKAELRARQALIENIAEQVWSIDRVGSEGAR